MPRVIYVTCPECGGEFYVGREFFEIDEAYCHCPFCNHQFNPRPAPPDTSAARIG